MRVTPLVFCFFGESAKFVAGIVLYLTGVVCNDVLRFSEGPCDASFHRADAVAVVPFWNSVHGLDQDYRHTLRCGHAIVIV